MIVQRDKLRLLVETGIALTSELSLDAVLQRLVQAAADITGARYAALGVIDRTGRMLERFLTTGVTDEQIEEIGELPVGRGILGLLIRDAQPLRLHDLTEHPRSVGFPPGHPPMKTFLGVPIALRGVAYGNLYLTEKEGGDDFTDEDQELVELLAAQAAVAIENARLYGSARRWLRQLETMTEVGNAIAGETDLPALLGLIVKRLRELLGARAVFIALLGDDDLLRVEASDHDGGESGVGLLLPPRASESGHVLARGRAERVDSLIDDIEFDRESLRRLCDVTQLPTPTSGIFVPLIAQDRTIGAISIYDRVSGSDDLRFTDDDVRIAEWFAQRAAVAVDLSRRVQRDALGRVVAAQELERRRLARELHDETGQALTSILLGLGGVEEAGSLEEARGGVATLKELTIQTLQDVRRLAVELRPSALDDFGLVPALERLIERFRDQTGISIDLEARLDGRLSSDLETTLYRIVQEALTNVIKHADARHVSIVLTQKDSAVVAVVEDDGRGFEPTEQPDRGLGLLGMRERLALLDGRLTVESSPGKGTTVAAEAKYR